MDRIGSGLRVSASFQIFALTVRGCPRWGGGNCPGGGTVRLNMFDGRNVQGGMSYRLHSGKVCFVGFGGADVRVAIAAYLPLSCLSRACRWWIVLWSRDCRRTWWHGAQWNVRPRLGSRRHRAVRSCAGHLVRYTPAVTHKKLSCRREVARCFVFLCG